MAVICSKPYLTEESRRAFVDTFREGLTRSRWLEEARPDESFSEWVERMRAESEEPGPA